jgi:hypothetical protein
MDFISKVTGQNQNQSQGDKKPDEPKEESSGGLMGKLNSLAGGGKDSEKNEDALDKGTALPHSRLPSLSSVLFSLRFKANLHHSPPSPQPLPRPAIQQQPGTPLTQC